jgi:hypothetical protein
MVADVGFGCPACLAHFHVSLSLMSSASSDSSSSSDDSTYFLSSSSKREYLLAQIRQKDSIIESLLKQVRDIYGHLI